MVKNEFLQVVTLTEKQTELINSGEGTLFSMIKNTQNKQIICHKTCTNYSVNKFNNKWLFIGLGIGLGAAAIGTTLGIALTAHKKDKEIKELQTKNLELAPC